MVPIKRAFRYLLHDRRQLLDSVVKTTGPLLPDKLYLSLRYRILKDRWINWENPQTFTEKIQWLKVYGFKPEYTKMVDKLAVKEYVARMIGHQYLIPTLGVWDRVGDISFNELPRQFVLKTTHGGGGTGVVICEDKSSLNINKAKEKLNRSLSYVVGREFREKPYYNVPRKVFAEQYMEASDGSEIVDYKFYCFMGSPRYCQVIRDRKTKETIDFYDMDWTLMPFVGLNPKCENGKIPYPKPLCLHEMISICETLSRDIPFVRIDLYEINNKPYFGEITFYPGGGFGRFSPEEWNEKLGSFIKLPHEN